MRYSFRPPLPLTVLLGLLLLGFVRLGLWQTERAADKQQRMDDFASASELSELPAFDEAVEFSRVSLQGRFRGTRHFLADNQIHNGRPGVHVLTEFELNDGRSVLVNRGWLPLTADRRLPEVTTASEHQEIVGRIGPIPRVGRQLGGALPITGDGDVLLTYPDTALIAQALGRDLYPWVLFLDANSPGGFAGRDWRAVQVTPGRHKAYAVQWYGLAAAAWVIWLVLGFKRGKHT